MYEKIWKVGCYLSRGFSYVGSDLTPAQRDDDLRGDVGGDGADSSVRVSNIGGGEGRGCCWIYRKCI